MSHAAAALSIRFAHKRSLPPRLGGYADGHSPRHSTYSADLDYRFGKPSKSGRPAGASDVHVLMLSFLVFPKREYFGFRLKCQYLGLHFGSKTICIYQ